MIARLVDLMHSIYGEGFLALHYLVFAGTERKDLVDCMDFNFVFSAGAQAIEMERRVAVFLNCPMAWR